MGQIYFKNQIDNRWFNIDEYFKITFHYEYGQYSNPKDIDDFLIVDEWPNIRRWIRDDCDGDVIIRSNANSYHRKWIDLYFECESDAMAFKLKWL